MFEGNQQEQDYQRAMERDYQEKLSDTINYYVSIEAQEEK